MCRCKNISDRDVRNVNNNCTLFFDSFDEEESLSYTLVLANTTNFGCIFCFDFLDKLIKNGKIKLIKYLKR